MKIYETVTQAKESLDRFLRANGDSQDGSHYSRPNGTNGPIVKYRGWGGELVFAVDRAEAGGWFVSGAWLRNDDSAVPPNILFGLRMWEGSVNDATFSRTIDVKELIALQADVSALFNILRGHTQDRNADSNPLCENARLFCNVYPALCKAAQVNAAWLVMAWWHTEQSKAKSESNQLGDREDLKMRKLFTKRFFRKSLSDQRQIVDSRLRDLKQALPYNDTNRVKAMIRHIERKAVEHGIYNESEAK